MIAVTGSITRSYVRRYYVSARNLTSVRQSFYNLANVLIAAGAHHMANELRRTRFSRTSLCCFCRKRRGSFPTTVPADRLFELPLDQAVLLRAAQIVAHMLESF